MNKKIEIYTDGSSLGNPGPGGWGVVIINNYELIIKNDKSESPEIIELGGGHKHTTNNRMEIQAVIEALKYIVENQKIIGNSEVIIHADSAYVLGGVTTWIHNWEKNGWKTANKKPVMNQELWQEMISLVRQFKGNLSWQKVKGHSGVLYNERADVIATENAANNK